MQQKAAATVADCTLDQIAYSGTTVDESESWVEEMTPHTAVRQPTALPVPAQRVFVVLLANCKRFGGKYGAPNPQVADTHEAERVPQARPGASRRPLILGEMVV